MHDSTPSSAAIHQLRADLHRFLKAVNTQPNDPSARILFAWAMLRAGHTAVAVIQLQNAIALCNACGDLDGPGSLHQQPPARAQPERAPQTGKKRVRKSAKARRTAPCSETL